MAGFHCSLVRWFWVLWVGGGGVGNGLMMVILVVLMVVIGREF